MVNIEPYNAGNHIHSYEYSDYEYDYCDYIESQQEEDEEIQYE